MYNIIETQCLPEIKWLWISWNTSVINRSIFIEYQDQSKKTFLRRRDDDNKISFKTYEIKYIRKLPLQEFWIKYIDINEM